jgi:hypothetical protein
VLGFSSCLKDKNIDDKKYGVKGIGDLNMAYFPRNWTAGGFYPGNKDTTIHILAVRLYSKDSVAQNEIRVKLRKRDDIIQQMAGVELAPEDKFRINSLEVVIPKGSDRGMLSITGNPQDIIGHNYAFAFELENTNSSNTEVDIKHDSIVAYLEMRNRYDGIYRLTGSMVDHVNELFTAEYPFTVELHSTGDNSVMLFDPLRYAYVTPMTSDGTRSAYGNVSPELAFDAGGKITSLTNGYGQGTGSRWLFPDATANNAYNFSNNTISAKFVMHQPNANTLRTSFNWMLTKISPRP